MLKKKCFMPDIVFPTQDKPHHVMESDTFPAVKNGVCSDTSVATTMDATPRDAVEARWIGFKQSLTATTTNCATKKILGYETYFYNDPF